MKTVQEVVEQQTPETTQATSETPFLRTWKSRDDFGTQDAAEYLGCGCGMHLGKA
jgi:hypothetical protein